MRLIVRFAAAAAFAMVAFAWSTVPAQEAAQDPPAKEAAIGPFDDGKITIGPKYAPAPELTVRPEVPKGMMKSIAFDMKASKVYPFKPQQKKGAKETRDVLVYIPSQYMPGTPAPFSVIQDANYKAVLPTILDNMIHDKRPPPRHAGRFRGQRLGEPQQGIRHRVGEVRGIHRPRQDREVAPRKD